MAKTNTLAYFTARLNYNKKKFYGGDFWFIRSVFAMINRVSDLGTMS